MATVISSDKLATHNVNSYNFKVLHSDDISKSVKSEKEEGFAPDATQQERVAEIDTSALSSSSKESLIESLMQKTDEMSSNFIKLQMKLESKEAEFEEKLKEVRQEAYNEGLQAGIAQAKESAEQDISERLNLLANSVSKLDNSAKEFESALEGIKKELITAALDIAQEVVKVELGNNSNEIAKLLSDELIKDLQSASNITLRVNPKNHGALSEHLGNLEKVTIVSDSAVSEGGVVVMSDAGNIDAQINKRFERVKLAALSE